MALIELINKKRGELNKTPIDHGSMKTHLILKLNVSHPGAFDFESSELKLDADKIAILQEIINEQFGIYLARLSSHCTFYPAKKTMKKPEPVHTPRSESQEPQSEGLMSKFGRMFGR
jgi:hypothetical protein